MQEAIITNHQVKPIEDGFRGVKYTFKPNEPIRVPMAAAVHMFGVGLADRAPAWRRHGFTQKDKGEAFLAKVEIKVVELVPETDQKELIDENASLKEQIAALHAQLEQPDDKSAKKK